MRLIVVINKKYENDQEFNSNDLAVFYLCQKHGLVNHDDNNTYKTATEFFGVSSGRDFIKYMIWRICMNSKRIKNFSSEFSRVTSIQNFISFSKQLNSKSVLGMDFGLKTGKLKNNSCEVEHKSPIIYIRPSSADDIKLPS